MWKAGRVSSSVRAKRAPLSWKYLVLEEEVRAAIDLAARYLECGAAHGIDISLGPPALANRFGHEASLAAGPLAGAEGKVIADR